MIIGQKPRPKFFWTLRSVARMMRFRLFVTCLAEISNSNSNGKSIRVTASIVFSIATATRTSLSFMTLTNQQWIHQRCSKHRFHDTLEIKLISRKQHYKIDVFASEWMNVTDVLVSEPTTPSTPISEPTPTVYSLKTPFEKPLGT